jgi:ABC-type Fe3+/spermidine/putrescine transport system ATPase subunit
VPNQSCLTNDVLVLVRPEAVRLTVTHGGGPAGVVEELEYRGDRVEYRVRVGVTLVIAVEASLQRGRRIVTGDRVGLEFVEQAVHLLPAQAGGTAVPEDIVPGQAQAALISSI